MSRISSKRLADLCHRVGTSYKAGVDVRTIWDREAKHGGPAHRLALGQLSNRVAEGGTVAEGMRQAGGYFPELTIAIVAAGEQGGRLERSFELLARHYDTIVRFQRELQTRMAWPLLELIGAVCIIGLLILAMGWVSSFSGGQPYDWIGFGWTTSQYFWAYVSIVVMITAGLAAFVFGVKEGWFGLLPMKIARLIPIVGKTIQILSLARFAWVLAAVYEAGMNTMEGIKLAFHATQNYFYQRLEDQVVSQIQAGRELFDILQETGAFPEDFLMYLQNGELTGQVPESMTRLAEQYTSEAEKNLNLLGKVLFMILFALVALMMIAMIVTLYYRLYFGRMQEFMM